VTSRHSDRGTFDFLIINVHARNTKMGYQLFLDGLEDILETLPGAGVFLRLTSTWRCRHQCACTFSQSLVFSSVQVRCSSHLTAAAEFKCRITSVEDILLVVNSIIYFGYV